MSDDDWLDEDPDEMSHRRLNAELMRRALARKYPTCPCSDPTCTGGKHP